MGAKVQSRHNPGLGSEFASRDQDCLHYRVSRSGQLIDFWGLEGGGGLSDRNRR